MSTRFYLPSSGSAAVSPAYDSSWEYTGGGARLPMATAPTNTSRTGINVTKTTSANPGDVLVRQYVSDPIVAGSVSGTFSVVVDGSEATTTADAFLQVVIRVVSNDGSTVRGTLYSGVTDTTASASSSSPAYEFPLGTNSSVARSRILSGVSLSSVTASANDRIVVDIGYRSSNVGTTRVAYLWLGDETAGSDAALSVDNNAGRPWIEFSGDLFGTPTPQRNAALTGSGSLSAVSKGVHVAAALLAGSGVLSATAREVERTTAPLTGSGALSATARAAYVTTAPLAGSGSLSATAYAVGGAVPRDGNLAGSGSLSALGKPSVAGSLAGSGSLTATVSAVATATANLAGTGTLTATAVEAGLGESLDLSTAVPLLGSPDWDGTSLPGGYYTFPYRAVDFATTYTVEVDYIHDGSGTPGFLGLFGILSPDDAGAVDTNYLFANDSTLTGAATATLTIGPGVGEWADAEAAVARFLMVYTARLAITAIRVSPELEPGLEPPAPAGTDTTNGAYLRTRGGWAVASWEPAVTPLPLPALGHAVVTAAAFGAVTMQGSQPVFTVSRAEKPRLRQRIVVGGVDMTLHRGVIAPDATFQLADPLLYGPATIELPSISAVFEQGAHPHLAKGKRAKVQLVDDDDVIVKTVHKGFVMAHGVSGRNLVLEVGGEAQGRASLRDKQPPIFRDVLDLSRHAWRAITDLGLRYLPRLGEPGIGIRSLTFGGTGMLEHIEEIIARATKKDGTQRTIMPDAGGVYRLSDKDTTTIHYTLFVDDAHVVPDLRSDMSEEPNRIYATTITPSGMRVRFGAYPGLIQGPTPDYPMDDNSSLTEGATDDDTDTGDGISVMINRLGATGFLDIRDTPGGFDEDVTDALAALQKAAGLTGPVGVMTPDLWAALWDLDVTGYDRRWSSIQPAAEDDSVRRFDRSASGAVIGLNADRDPDEIPVDRTVDMGSGFTRKQARDFAASLVHDPDADDWFGTITVNTGAVLAGTVAIGATVTAADLVDARLVKPGENIYLPNFAGGIVVHVSGVEVSATNVRFTVDTRARPAREVWERIQVRRESRRNPARGWVGTRQSTSIKDAVQGFDEIGGVVDRNVPLEAGWNKIEVVAGDYGQIGAFRSIVQTVSGTGGDIAIEPHEYAVMVFGKEPSVARLNSDVGNPLTETGERAIRRSAKGYLDSRWLLYSAGTEAEPCGYGADRKSDGATLTGEHVDAASFSYAADNGCTLFVAIWVAEATSLRKGRIMWPQLEGGV